MAEAIVGIICEYNPFHLGHRYHIQSARTAAHAEKVIAVMSGPFTQRGDAALFSPVSRARMALYAGADLVFELPALFSVREAEHFALGGVALLTNLGCTHIAFGCETDDLALLKRAAALLSDPTPDFQADFFAALKSGQSHARARGEALKKALHTDVLGLPNNVLALCYLSALRTLQSPLIPVPIQRVGGYHDISQPEMAVFPSATALRGAILRGDWRGIQAMTPPEVYPILRREIVSGLMHRPEALDNVLRAKLLDADSFSLAALPGASEGLDRLLIKCRDRFISREALLTALKSKRYTYTRLNRLLTHLLLNVNQDALPARPHYARLLGMTADAAGFLRPIKKSGFPIIEKAADFDREDASFQTDMRAYDLWALGAGLPFGLGFRQSPAVIDRPGPHAV